MTNQTPAAISVETHVARVVTVTWQPTATAVLSVVGAAAAKRAVETAALWATTAQTAVHPQR